MSMDGKTLPNCYRCGKQPCECKDRITLYHADCREVLPLLEPVSVDLVLTDPPYGHNNNNGDLISKREEALGKGVSPKEKFRPIANDGTEANDFAKLLFAESARLLKPGCCCCCCCCCGGGGGPDPQFARWSLWLDDAIPFKQMVIWDKGPMGMGWHYRRSYETVLVAQQPGAACKWNGGRKTENILRPDNKAFRKIIPALHQHPTEKPVGLAGLFVEIHSDPGDLVLDPFAGSGWSGRAAKDLGRKAILIEIEERYCQIAANRLKQGVLFP